MQKTIFNSNETWIQDVVKLMNGNYGNQERLVHVNNTEYPFLAYSSSMYSIFIIVLTVRFVWFEKVLLHCE